MSEPATSPQADKPLPAGGPQSRRRIGLGAVLGVLSLLSLALAAWGYYFYYPDQLGPEQPISFSHRVHVTDKKLSCVFCHTGAIDTARAGVPPVETCMLCHKKIISQHPQIRLLTKYYDTPKAKLGTDGLEWTKVNELPEFTYFNHQRHVRSGVDCGQCHGDIAGMDRVKLAQEFTMGFCVQCHRDNKISHDCAVCHR